MLRMPIRKYLSVWEFNRIIDGAVQGGLQSYGSDIGGIIPDRVSIYHGGTGWLLWTASPFIISICQSVSMGSMGMDKRKEQNL
jgi:hypothetical protein